MADILSYPDGIYQYIFTPFRIEDAQYATPSPLITAHKVGVLNEKRCNTALFLHPTHIFASFYYGMNMCGLIGTTLYATSLNY